MRTYYTRSSDTLARLTNHVLLYYAFIFIQEFNYSTLCMCVCDVSISIYSGTLVPLLLSLSSYSLVVINNNENVVHIHWDRYRSSENHYFLIQLAESLQCVCVQCLNKRFFLKIDPRFQPREIPLAIEYILNSIQIWARKNSIRSLYILSLYNIWEI